MNLEVPDALAGERLDRIVALEADLARNAASELVASGAVTVNGRVVTKGSARVATGDIIAAVVPDVEDDAVVADPDLAFAVVYEDDDVLVIDKPPGLVVHPGAGRDSGTLVHGLVARYPEIAAVGEPSRPGIVHRLDAGTSGLMIVALDETALERLQRMLADREVSRTYTTLVEGNPPPAATIDAPIGRSPRHRKKMAVVAGGRDAVTELRRLETFSETALVEARPRTGRTHQIRVHLAGAGYPVVGDRVYGRDRKLAARLGLDRPFLHASGLSFRHPMTGEQVALEEPLPADLLEALGRARG